MHNVDYKNWNEFKSKIVNDLLNSSGKASLRAFLFRGQAVANWELNSSFDRIENDKSKYNKLLDNFISICKTYNFNEDLMNTGDNEIISAYAQHYGLPTRLLDWTNSPYFAAFFAFSSALSHPKNKCCTVWAINKESEALQRQQGVKFIELSTNKYNYRMKNQLGNFTLSEHTENSIDEFDKVLVSKRGIDDLLWKFNIKYKDSKEVKEILADLEIMGITYSFAYPDIVGYIEEAVYKTEITR